MRNWVLPLLVIFVIAIWLTSGIVLYDNPDRGTIGDMFGAVNSLFSGLAFAGLVFTIFLQKNELGLQRKELEYTRNELKGQKEIMQAQNDQLQHQAFEGTFFQMVRIHNELLSSIDLTSGGGDKAVKVLSGRDCFMTAWKRYYSAFSKNADTNDKELRKKQIADVYKQLWIQYEGEFGHYFRSLYNIFKFVHNSKIENKKFYTNIVRAQLSGQELIIMLYNGIFFGTSKFIPLIEEYALLKHIPSHAIPCDVDFTFYKETAFGKEYPCNKSNHEDDASRGASA